eukprot:scaffold5173_cov125-Isochrysis_galbana.AAC.8
MYKGSEGSLSTSCAKLSATPACVMKFIQLARCAGSRGRDRSARLAMEVPSTTASIRTQTNTTGPANWDS